MKTLIIIMLFSFVSTIVLSADRYWISPVAGSWSNPSNWSTSSGGPGGASVPSVGDFVYFNEEGIGNCNLNIAASFDGIDTEGYPGIIELNGFLFNPTVSGSEDCDFLGGTINDSPGTSEVRYVTSGRTRFENVEFGARINISSGRIEFNGGVFKSTVRANQNGASSSSGDGGCVFEENSVLSNSGSGRLILGSANPDIFQSNLELLNDGAGSIILADGSALNSVEGDLTITSTGNSDEVVLAKDEFSSLVVNGDVLISSNSSASSSELNIGDAGSVNIVGRLDIVHVINGNSSKIIIANDESSAVVIGGVTNIIKSGNFDDSRCYIGRKGDVTFNDSLILLNNSSSSSNEFILNQDATSNNIYNGHIVISNTQVDGDGVFFGEGGGAGVLATNKKVSIGSGGFLNGTLHFENFTQIGTTSHSFTLSGKGVLNIESCDWGGDFSGIAASITTSSSLYNGIAYLEKTGNGSDDSEGGNVFSKNVELKNSGIDDFVMGSDNPDVFTMNLLLNNTGESRLYIANSSLGNTIGGNLTINNDGSGSGDNLVRIAHDVGSSLTIDGNVIINNIGNSENSSVYLPYRGNIILNGDLTVDNSPLGTDGSIYFSADASGSLTVNGNTLITHGTTGGDTKRIRIGDEGTVIFNGSTSISNNSNANDNIVRIADNSGSTVTFNGNLVIENTQVNGEGFHFGNNGGGSNLTSGHTLSIGSGGFDSGELVIENLTQTGLTAQSITLTGDAIFEILSSSWEGDITFVSPRIVSENSIYRGLSYLEKTSDSDDRSSGGNVFEKNATLRNTGSGYFRMGDSSFDRWDEDLTILSDGEGDMEIAHGSFGNVISGDLSITAASGGASSQDVIVSDDVNSSLLVFGNTTIVNNSSGSENNIIIGDNGDVNFLGDLSITNSASSNKSDIIIGNSVTSEVTIAGATTVINSGLGGDNKRIFLGDKGDIIFFGTLNLTNSSNSNRSEILLNNDFGSENLYYGNIILNATSSNTLGIYFGEEDGSGSLSAGSTITIGPGGYIAQQLLLKNFNQLGTTAQTLQINSGTTEFEVLKSVWNGSILIESPRLVVNNSTFHLNTTLHKNGASDDESAGGNTFNGVTTIRNSGSGGFTLSESLGNSFGEDVTYQKLGSGEVYPAYNATSKYAKSIFIESDNTVRFGASGVGSVSMNGSTAQAISVVGATPMPEFVNLQTLNLVEDITLNTPIKILRLLVLLKGNINSSAANMLIMEDNSFVASVSDDAFVNGPVTKIGDDIFTFPVGKGNFYRPIELASKPSSSSAEFRGEYFPQSVASGGIPNSPLDISINSISSCEYWLLDRLVSNSSVAVKLYYKNTVAGSCSGVVDQSTLLVSRWNGSTWVDHGNGGSSGSISNGSVRSSSAISSFSPFTIGTTNDINPLPIDLIDFTAEKQLSSSLLSWTTLSELNNDYFDLERSTDGFNFETITTVKGAGNSSIQMDYDFLDREPKEGINYYRLKQVDFDGDYIYSDIKSIHFDDVASLNLYPNPLTSGHELTVSSSQLISSIEIINETGQLIQNLNFEEKQNIAKLNHLKVNSGFYFVKVYYEVGFEVKKLIVH